MAARSRFFGTRSVYFSSQTIRSEYPPESHAAGMFIGAGVRERQALGAVLLESGLAVFTLAAGIDHAAHRCQIAFLELLHLAADARDAPDNFVTRHERVGAVAPFAAAMWRSE